MDTYQIFSGHCHDHIEQVMALVDDIAAPLEQAAELLTGTLLQDRKVVTLGLGADAALAQLFCGHFSGQLEQERPALPVMALAADGTAITASLQASDADELFARLLRSLGQEGDLLLCLCSDSPGAALQRAMEAARERHMAVVLLHNPTSPGAGQLAAAADIVLPVAAPRRPLSLELYTLLLNSLCELIDHGLFGGYYQD